MGGFMVAQPHSPSIHAGAPARRPERRIDMRAYLIIALAALGATAATCPPALGAAPADAADAAALPRVLSDADRDLYRRIFDLQEEARWSEADALVKELGDDILVGYVERQRYMHPTGYRATYEELRRWLAYHADIPSADEIYALAVKRRPKRASPPVRPTPRRWRSAETAHDLHPLLEGDASSTSRATVARIEGRVRHLCRKEQAGEAVRELERHAARRDITIRQYDRMRSWAAASYYFQGYLDAAERMARDIAAENGDVAVLSYWIGGLIAFRKGDFEGAYDNFARMAKNPYQEDALRAAAGFWASRAALAAGKTGGVTRNLEIAADFPFTFYGQLALAQLGREYPYDWTPPALSSNGFAALVAAAPAVRRAVALAEAGETIDADLELRWANGHVGKDQTGDLLAVAAALDLPAAQIDIALSAGGRAFEAGLYPIPAYEPSGGFKTDRALLYALMRQESKFKVEATSRVGARGLMQLMPRTASFMAKDKSLAKGKGRNRLYDPAYNLELGQTYVNHLIETTSGGDLFETALAYNGGPGNLNRWKRELAIDDPLLFIESVPNPESRDFVEKVLTNFWIYRARLGQPPRERDLVAAGKLPLYEALDRISE
jgi:soluble lytic murein transglycosylase-like protein